jgi:hypothetical protein
MSDKITVVGPSPYRAWRVNFHDQGNGMKVVFTAVIDAPDRDAAWRLVYDHYAAMSQMYPVHLERELRPPSEWEKP